MNSPAVQLRPVTFSSRIPGFYNLNVQQRQTVIEDNLGASVQKELRSGGMDIETANGMIENVIGLFALPLGVSTNFLINNKEYIVPMAIEEPSVVAAASHAAKLVRSSGGFRAKMTEPQMIGQVQLTDITNVPVAAKAIRKQMAALIDHGNKVVPGLVARGGGIRNIEIREFADHHMLVVHILVDCQNAMGANMVNTIAESLAKPILRAAGDGNIGLRILSNLSDKRLVTVHAEIDEGILGGSAVREAIVSASTFASIDPYRAATHNKGIMNGVDGVLLATGNDWRSAEAGAHAFAARSGKYSPLATWQSDGTILQGRLVMPMSVAIVGGALHVHKGAQLSLEILGVSSATELACVAASCGLATNLAALRALATEGIQKGHMSLHAKMIAKAAGARGDLIEKVATEMSARGEFRLQKAVAILQQMNSQGPQNLCLDDQPAPSAKQQHTRKDQQ